jgi:hypothetical protein
MIEGMVPGTVGEVRKREGDVLYGLVLLFTYGQLALILWDQLVLIPGFAGLTGLADPGKIHSIGEITGAYLGLLGTYIGRNAYRQYQGKDDKDALPQYVFLRIKRGYFYLSLWGTFYFVSLMLMAMSITSRLPYELALTATGVLGGLVGDSAVKYFLNKRSIRQLETAAAASDNHATVMDYVEKNGRITNAECRQVTGVGDAQATNVLQALEKEGKLEQVGTGRYVYYRKKGSNT